MSTGTSSSQGIFGSFPYEVVITPATIAGLVIALTQYLVNLGISPMASVSLNSIVGTLIQSVAWIGFLVAVLAIVVSGAQSDVLVVGAILTYVAELLTYLLSSIYRSLVVGGGGLELSFDLFLAPFSLVVIVVGIGIGVNWIGVDVSL